MTNINDLQERINSMKTVLAALKADLEELKQQQQPESLLGRWATHKEYGRGVIGSIQPDSDGEVRFTYRNSSYTDAVNTRFVRPESLTIDPATLTTTKDFEDAPEGTIVEATEHPKDVIVKTEVAWYKAGDKRAIAVEYMPTCRVIRWGNGDEH